MSEKRPTLCGVSFDHNTVMTSLPICHQRAWKDAPSLSIAQSLSVSSADAVTTVHLSSRPPTPDCGVSCKRSHRQPNRSQVLIQTVTSMHDIKSMHAATPCSDMHMQCYRAMLHKRSLSPDALDNRSHPKRPNQSGCARTSMKHAADTSLVCPDSTKASMLLSRKLGLHVTILGGVRG